MIGAELAAPDDWEGFRRSARNLLAAGVPPHQVEWRLAGEAAGLFGQAPIPATPGPGPAVPRGFLALAEVVARHRDPQRFALLYRVLWRLTHGEPGLMATPTDADTARLEAMAKSVRRDAHKLHAFLRFRRVETPEGEHWVAWFEPDHHILRAEAGFFQRRFAEMRWSIVTPELSAHWDGADVTFAPGGRREDVPGEADADDLWRTYYAAIFNPARLKPAAMRAEMPKKYWRNLPEAREIPRLLEQAPRLLEEMVARGATPPAPRRQRAVHLAAPAQVAPAMQETPEAALAALRAEVLADPGPEPWGPRATQSVFGEGPLGAALMFVGEQPGDEEDIAGRPFVGPAGRLFNRALAEAGVAREQAWVTNAVKRFKYTPTGRRRLHQGPDAGDITHYKPFLRREIALVQPRLLVALGASALRALTGKPLAVGKARGQLLPQPEGPPVFATVHPSYLLRLPDAAAKAEEYARFVGDLRAASDQSG